MTSVLKAFDLMATLQGLVLVNVGYYVPFGVLLFMGFVKGVPRELEEAAELDGASRFRVFWQVVFPLLRPASASVLIFLGVWIWNDFLTPLIVLGPDSGTTVTVGVYRAIGQYESDFGDLFAFMFLATLPILIFYAADRTTWQNIINALPPIPRTTQNGQTVYALADPGTMTGGDTRVFRPGDNTVNLEFIHPGEVLGLSSPAADRQVAITSLDQMNSWGQENSFPKVFTQAARVGYPAQSLIDKLKGQLNTKLMQNGRVYDGNHGLEKAGAIEAVNSMLLQTDGGVMRVFPVWPSGKNGSFVKLRAKNAFVVSSARSGGQVGYVDITSGTGKQVRLANPWPGRTVLVTRVGTGTVSHTVANDVITFPTVAGATYSVTVV
ncbi:carbohydrate ABC transporter permease [Acrocarpospora sp. B8E8]|uniref:carbohydrate ABC transporter permease n=1 Tax=Acrocarpospora sp. B8E8 TaxID=3153572 RepID=UPI00325FB8B1